LAVNAGRTEKIAETTEFLVKQTVFPPPFISMAKSKSKRKQNGLQDGRPTKKPKAFAVVTPPPENPAEPKTLSDLLIAEEDLEIAVDTLKTLSENPSLIKSKACKDLRTAVFEFRRACTTGFNASGMSSKS